MSKSGEIRSFWKQVMTFVMTFDLVPICIIAFMAGWALADLIL